MVISLCVLDLLGTVPYLIYNMIGILLNISNELEIFGDLSEGLLMVAAGSKIFIYYNFNKLFRQNFSSLFRFKK